MHYVDIHCMTAVAVLHEIEPYMIKAVTQHVILLIRSRWTQGVDTELCIIWGKSDLCSVSRNMS